MPPLRRLENRETIFKLIDYSTAGKNMKEFRQDLYLRAGEIVVQYYIARTIGQSPVCAIGPAPGTLRRNRGT